MSYNVVLKPKKGRYKIKLKKNEIPKVSLQIYPFFKRGTAEWWCSFCVQKFEVEIMAVAETKMQYDGHWYNPGDTLPDLGSLVGRGGEGGLRSYEGHYSDRTKLPKYDDLATGSDAFLSDDGSFKLFVYYADTKTWEGNGEVF